MSTRTSRWAAQEMRALNRSHSGQNIRPATFSTFHNCFTKRSTSLKRELRATGHRSLGRVEDVWSSKTPCIPNRTVRSKHIKTVYPNIRAQGANDHVYVALGSNIGDRFGAIEDACRKLDQDDNVQILETSPLYETEPMYVEDQDRFLNGVCQIETKLSPIDLLDKLQAIENDLGRVKIIDKGPRNIDLDIVAHKDEVVQTKRLTVPHALMLEREFVLRPLCDTQGANFIHPVYHTRAADDLQKLPPSSTPMYPVTPLGPEEQTLRALDPRRTTKIMSILNVTPDSFSDGGVNDPSSVSALTATIKSHIAAGATIIDIGGQSSRPNAKDVTAVEELARVLPAIRAIKALPDASHITISIDTYRAAVAEGAVAAGAHIVNDISAGLLDPDMLPTVARLGCTYVMMHMRGTPATMQGPSNTTYAGPGGVVAGVALELADRVQAAQAAGIRRWRMILDPGVGFAKTVEQNLELLTSLSKLRTAKPILRGLPWLLGTSRKSFIGAITGLKNPLDRVWGTAATVTAAVQGGADIVRVHDVAEMAQVVQVADAMYRR